MRKVAMLKPLLGVEDDELLVSHNPHRNAVDFHDTAAAASMKQRMGRTGTAHSTFSQALAVLEIRFGYYDIDQCGCITFEQLCRRMALSGFRDTNKLSQLFDSVDLDRSGTLEFGEFLMLMYLVEPLDKLFKQPSLDSVASAWSVLERWFSKADIIAGQLLLHRADVIRFLLVTLGDTAAASPDVSGSFQDSNEITFSEFMHLLYKIVMVDGKHREKSIPRVIQEAARAISSQGSLTSHNASSAISSSKSVMSLVSGSDRPHPEWERLDRAFQAMEDDFCAFDKENRGYLELGQLTRLTTPHSEAETVDILSRIQKHFKQVDLNESRTITFDEFMYMAFLLMRDGAYQDVVEHATDSSLVKGTLIALKQSFKRHDVDSSLRLDTVETNQLLVDILGTVPARTNDVFMRLRTSSTRPSIDFVRTMRLIYELVRENGKFVGQMPSKPHTAHEPIPVKGAVIRMLQRRTDMLSEAAVEKQELLGSGMYARAHKALLDGHTVVAKLYSDFDVQEAKNEVEFLSEFDHKNILYLVGARLEPPVVVVTEFCENGSLFDCLHKRQMDFQLSTIWQIARDTASAIVELHTHNPPLIHSNISSLNILLDSDLHVKLTGFCQMKHVAKAFMDVSLTPQWTAPEMLACETYDVSCDIYSFGVTLWELLHREIPFIQLTNDEMVKGVIAGARPKTAFRCPVGFAQLIAKCWNADPASRPNISEVIRDLDGMKFDMGVDESRARLASAGEAHRR
eukprot:TRINITY_DN5417_c1_g1_i3.p1 TRINITY_DN5417_c1_g1~~TRINITY_DN5417_c1_g1_i3.p1  ORF type:complete len:741 (-),score=152.57 TRINITY_DN5417_c1_g1_i3:38-2260(-)